ncbi:MAG: ATP-binding protein [Deltaproteobacteria bacterium]|nr:ATP-binding protein [Candidatus Anaeroferrophillus wilburensis]MBN2888702.1 ATP-binding protein [Deltaproteobacteria bacterium]
MIITIASGKGGTGKTTIATNFALSIPDAQYIDCDVEEPNGNLFLNAEIVERLAVGTPLPQVDLEQCTFCGDCAKACEFNALAVLKKKVLVFPELCHGCGVCRYICPAKAISEGEKRIGIVETGIVHQIQGDDVAFAQGVLNVGEPMSPPLIKRVKQCALAGKTVILDAPPGTSCPVIQTLNGSDFCLLVTEPTPFGLNDLELAVGVVRLLEIPFGVIINRCDSGDQSVVSYCRAEGIPILMELPLNRDLAFAYSKGIPFVAEYPEAREQFRHLLWAIHKELKP